MKKIPVEIEVARLRRDEAVFRELRQLVTAPLFQSFCVVLLAHQASKYDLMPGGAAAGLQAVAISGNVLSSIGGLLDRVIPG